MVATAQSTFPTLSTEEINGIRPLAAAVDYADGEHIFEAGQPDMDFLVVDTGGIDILNPTDGNCLVATLDPGDFFGEREMLIRRRPLVTGVARGYTRVLRVSGGQLRELHNRIPELAEKLTGALAIHCQLLAGVAGVRVIGPCLCEDTALVCEFLSKQLVPFQWLDPAMTEGEQAPAALGSPRQHPVITFPDGRVLINPSLPELAHNTGVGRPCSDQEVDLAVVGAGLAGLNAALRAASAGISTVVIDRVGPGGHGVRPSPIEGSCGVSTPAVELLTSVAVQMFKCGVPMIAPANVVRLEPAAAPGEPHTLFLDCGVRIRVGLIVLATGVDWRKLAAANADEFEGAGLYYNFNPHEAAVFNAADVAVVGAGESAGQAALQLARCGPERRVHLLIRDRLGPKMPVGLLYRIRRTASITIHEEAEITAFLGHGQLQAVEIGGTRDGWRRPIRCVAVFAMIGSDASTIWLPAGLARDSRGFIITGSDAAHSGAWPLKDRGPLPLETTVPGVLAAGDIRSGLIRGMGSAAEDGAHAGASVGQPLGLRH